MATLHELLISKSGTTESNFNGALIACANTLTSGAIVYTASEGAIRLAQQLSSQSMMTAGSALSYLNSSVGITALAAA